MFLLLLSLFCFFCFFCVFFVFFVFLCFVFFGGFKGQVRWPKGPPHLALNPPYFFVFVFFCFFWVFVFFGSGEVAQGPPHLALNPPYLFFFVFWVFCFFLCFAFFVFNRQKTCFPPRKGHFLFIFNVSLSFSLNLFWPPPFSVSLSPSLCFSCLSFFLLVFLLCFLFVSCFCLFFIFLSSLLLFHEKNNMNIFNWNFFFSWNIFSFFWFPVLLFCFKSLFLIFVFFPDFKLCFLFNISMFLVSKRTNWKAQKKKTNCNKTGFFYEPVFCKMWKVIVFLPLFLPNFGSCSKNTLKIGISSHF